MLRRDEIVRDGSIRTELDSSRKYSIVPEHKPEKEAIWKGSIRLALVAIVEPGQDMSSRKHAVGYLLADNIS